MEPVCASDTICQSAPGRPATMPAKMIRLVPLPTPRVVICSPSHMRNSVPPVRVAMVEIRKNTPGWSTTPPGACISP